MHLSEVPYMRWAKKEAGKGDIPLTMSAVPAVDWPELGFDPRELELYSWTDYGDPEILEGIASRWGREGSEVLLASSATHAHFCLGASSLTPGDRVLYESPGYLPLVDSLSVLDVEAIRFQRRFEDGYALPQDEIIKFVEHACPRLLLVTHLHNPSSTALTEDEVAFLVNLCERFDVEVLCDETYRPFLDPDPGPLYLRHPNIMSVWGLNKVHGLPMIRVGWGMATPERLDLARRIVDSTTVHNSCLSDQVARFAIPQMKRLEERARNIAAAGWAVARPILESLPLEIVWPDNGLTAFPRIPTELFADGDELREALLEVGVGITPGKFFESEHHFRMGVGLDPEDLRRALERMRDVFQGRQ